MTISNIPETKNQDIPESLIYEIVKGKPIYYKGYQDVLNKTKTIEEIMPESLLQAWLKTHLSALLLNLLFEKGYDIVSGELGINISKKDKRGADISIIKREKIKLTPNYINIPPEIIIEIDVQADTSDSTDMDYILGKIEDYLNFGVKKVIWIFTKSEKVIVTDGNPFHTFKWNEDISIMEGVSINIQHLIDTKILK